MPYELKLRKPPAGYALASARPGDEVEVSAREFVTTADSDLLISRLEGFPSQILEQLGGIRPSSIDHMLVVIQRDATAAVYVNELNIAIRGRVTRAFAVGEPVLVDDLTDVERLEFEGVSISRTTGVVFVFSVGWRRGMYYDFCPLSKDHPPREYDLGSQLGLCYTTLVFQHLFQITSDEWTELFSQGWFPFVRLGTETIKRVLNQVRSGWHVDELLPDIGAALLGRLDSLVVHWSQISSLADHTPLLEKAVHHYREGDYVSSIAIVYPRIEGVMRSYWSLTKQAGRITQKRLSRQATQGSGRPLPLLLPTRFESFLNDVCFANFDPSAPRGISRHTVGHGVAPAKEFDLKNATLGLLILEQLSYCLSSGG